jgi:hypothetical protein
MNNNMIEKIKTEQRKVLRLLGFYAKAFGLKRHKLFEMLSLPNHELADILMKRELAIDTTELKIELVARILSIQSRNFKRMQENIAKIDC